jgi:hypothetical protein
MDRERFVIIVLVSLILFLWLIYVGLIVQLSIENVSYSATLDEIESYKTENLVLKDKILSASSLQTIYQKAVQAGFVPSHDPIAL